jgi:hypothetical protein
VDEKEKDINGDCEEPRISPKGFHYIDFQITRSINISILVKE